MADASSLPVSSRGHSKKSRDKAKDGKGSRSKRAGLIFPVGRIERHLRQMRIVQRVSQGSAIYLAGVLEYLCAEVLELAGNAGKDAGKKRITARHITLSVRSDEELNKLLRDVTIPSGGVAPFVHHVLLPERSHSEKKPKTEKKADENGAEKKDDTDEGGDAKKEKKHKSKKSKKSAEEDSPTPDSSAAPITQSSA